MGNGIAYVAASHGHDVVMYDVQLALAQRGFDAIRATLQRHVEKKRIDQAELQTTLDRIQLTAELGDMARTGLVIEAVPEDLALKRDIFHSLDHICDPEALLCSNTSSLSITALAGATKRPEQVAGLHFFNPAPMMALIEVVQGDRTSDATIGYLVDLARRWGKTPIVTRDTPGFIVNRIARPFYGEALRLLDHQIADAATIDRVVRAAGFKLGPFELLDLIGLDVNLAVTKSIYEAYFQEPRFQPHPLQQRMADAGLLGRKSGRGFYEYPTENQP
jgi:3-hydroxybutyryl-CoA dehydrogenase